MKLFPTHTHTHTHTHRVGEVFHQLGLSQMVKKKSMKEIQEGSDGRAKTR
jgi:hypothetical protein